MKLFPLPQQRRQRWQRATATATAIGAHTAQLDPLWAAFKYMARPEKRQRPAACDLLLECMGRCSLAWPCTRQQTEQPLADLPTACQARRVWVLEGGRGFGCLVRVVWGPWGYLLLSACLRLCSTARRVVGDQEDRCLIALCSFPRAQQFQMCATSIAKASRGQHPGLTNTTSFAPPALPALKRRTRRTPLFGGVFADATYLQLLCEPKRHSVCGRTVSVRTWLTCETPAVQTWFH